MLGGTEAWWLKERGDALLETANALVREQQPMTAARFKARADSPHSLHRMLQTIVRCMRAQIDPFSGILEAPRSVARLYRDHSETVKAAETTRTQALEPLLRDAADAWFASLVAPIAWDDLVARGVPRSAPAAPPIDDDFL